MGVFSIDLIFWGQNGRGYQRKICISGLEKYIFFWNFQFKYLANLFLTIPEPDTKAGYPVGS